MFKNLVRSLIIPLVLASSRLFAEIEYEINDIGTLQTHSSQAIALNNNGQILGWYNIDGSSSGKHFFVRERDGGFHEIPSKENGVGNSINWRYLVDGGKAYGTFDGNANLAVLYTWDQYNGVVNLGALPGKEISAINNAGQVLIKSVSENKNGKSIVHPVVWENGKIINLYGLEGDIGVEPEESYGFDMNNNGDVVGQSVVYLSYKNNTYKKIHAVKWINGQAIDFHKKIPKANKTKAIAVNDLGEVLIYAGETREYLPKYLVRSDGGVTVFSYSLNKLNNSGYVYNVDYDYGVPTVGKEWCVIQDRNGKDLFHSGEIALKIGNDYNSIWTDKIKILDVNDRGEMIVKGKTIYEEEHAMLLTPIKSE